MSNVFLRFLFLLWALTISFGAPAVSPFQRAVDSIAALPGGGTLRVPAGEHVTGTLRLRSGVTLHLDKGAVILGSVDPYDYDGYLETADDRAAGVADKCSKPQFGLIVARDARNIAITGEGTIDGRGLELALAIDSLHHIGERVDPNYNTRRMRPALRPKLIDFDSVDTLTIEGVDLRASASWGLSLNKCADVVIKDIDFVNRAYWNNDGIDIADCHKVKITGCKINSADDGIVLKSFDPEDGNEDIVISDCDIASSANALKMGTESFGGFRNVTVRNIRVRDTFRSAIALETVDGAVIDNIVIDSIDALNTGNALFVRLGHRRGAQPGSLANVTISNLKCEVPFGRPDTDYDLRGPDINTIHNPFPASITGIPGHRVENITLRNIEVSYPGRGTKGMAYIGAYRYKDVPEKVDEYPEFHMFGELPAWGLFVRHVDGLVLDNVKMSVRQPDYRPVMVAVDDVHNLTGNIECAQVATVASDTLKMSMPRVERVQLRSFVKIIFYEDSVAKKYGVNKGIKPFELTEYINSQKKNLDGLSRKILDYFPDDILLFFSQWKNSPIIGHVTVSKEGIILDVKFILPARVSSKLTDQQMIDLRQIVLGAHLDAIPYETKAVQFNWPVPRALITLLLEEREALNQEN